MSRQSKRVCTKCGLPKPVDGFRPGRSKCLDCSREEGQVRARKWRAENSEYAREQARLRWANRTEQQQRKDADRQAERRQTERYQERQKEWRGDNAERVAQTQKQWREQNPEKLRGYRKNASPEAIERRRQYQRERRASQRRMVRDFAAECGCVDCGTHNGPFEFDHRDKADKSYNVSQMMGYSDAAIWAEIAKCDVRCGTCHRQRHAGERAQK